MRIRMAAVALLIASLTAGCTSSGSHKTSAYCKQLTTAAQRLVSAEADLYKSGRGGAALSRIVTELRGLEEGAPDEIKTALAELASAVQKAQQLLQHPTQQARSELAQVATKLTADGKKVSDYIAAKCK